MSKSSKSKNYICTYLKYSAEAEEVDTFSVLLLIGFTLLMILVQLEVQNSN